MLWTAHWEIRANRAKLGERYQYANEIEAKQLDALERKSHYSRLPLSLLKLLTSKDVIERVPRNFETIGVLSTKKE